MSTLFLHDDGIVHRTHDAFTTRHALHAHKLVIPVDAPILLTSKHGDESWIDTPVLVTAHTAQSMGSEGVGMAVFWEPEHRWGRSISAQWSNTAGRHPGVHLLEGRLARELIGLAREAHQHTARDDAMHALLKRSAKLLCPEHTTRRLDPRIARVQELIRHTPHHKVTRDEAATAVELSPSRLSHLFKQETGITFQRYALWVRTRAAIQRVREGAPLTEAALAAGFSDHAHLTRTMRAFVGQPPSYLQRA